MNSKQTNIKYSDPPSRPVSSILQTNSSLDDLLKQLNGKAKQKKKKCQKIKTNFFQSFIFFS